MQSIARCHLSHAEARRTRRQTYPCIGRAAACCGSSNLFTASDLKPQSLTRLSDITRLTGGDGAVGTGGVCPYYVGEIGAGEVGVGEVGVSEVSRWAN